jgi:putative transposase
MQLPEKTYVFKVSCFLPLTDTQWAKIQGLVETPYTTGRPRKVDLRLVVDGLRYLVRTGCQWRNVPSTYEKKSVLWYYFDKWKRDKTWSKILFKLVGLRRVQLNRCEQPSLGAIDSQSVKIAPLISEDKGIDGNKKVNGRKRNIIVDTQSLPLSIGVSAANENDGKEGVKLLPDLQKNYPSVQNITADATYRKTFENAASDINIQVEISQKPESQQGFVPQKNRWQVERSFAWLNFYRRLAKDYEKTTTSSITMIEIAFISMILNHF